MEGLELAASPSFLQTTCGEEGGAAVRGRPTPSRPWGPVGTDCPVAQDRLCPPELWGQEGAQRRPSGPVCACPPSPPHSPPRHRSHRCGPGLTVVQWGLPPRGGGGAGRGGGLRTRCPEWGLGTAPVTPLPSWLPRGPQGQHAPTRPMGGERSASPKPQRGPASQSQGTPRPGGVAEQRGSHGHPQCEHHLCAGSQTDTRGRVRGPGSGHGANQTNQANRTGFSGRGGGEEQRWGREGGRKKRGGGRGGGSGGGQSPRARPQALAAHIAHLPDDGLLLLTQVLLTAVLQRPVEVFMHL